MPWLICIPLRLMVRICPLGRITADPPPRSVTWRPGIGRFTFICVAILPLAFSFPIGPRWPVVPSAVEWFMAPVPFGRFMVPVPPGLPVVDSDLPIVPVFGLPPIVVLLGLFPMVVAFGLFPIVVLGLFPVLLEG